MALELHDNDVSRQAKSTLWIFEGRSLVYLVAGAMGSLTLFKAQELLFVPVLINVSISAVPVCVATLFVFSLVQGKAPSYAWDAIVWRVFEFRAWLFRAGITTQPPQLWRNPKPLPPLSDFTRE